MNARTKPPDLQLEHTSDEHSDVLAQIAALRARGKHELADQIERGYRASTGRGAFGSRTRAPSPPPPQRRKHHR